MTITEDKLQGPATHWRTHEELANTWNTVCVFNENVQGCSFSQQQQKRQLLKKCNIKSAIIFCNIIWHPHFYVRLSGHLDISFQNTHFSYSGKETRHMKCASDLRTFSLFFSFIKWPE